MKNTEDNPPLNPVVLDQIREMANHNNQTLLLLLDSFLSDVEKLTAEIETTISNGNLTQVKTLNHTLKGLCGTIGATKMHNISVALDLILKKNDLTHLDIFIDSIKKEYYRCRSYIEEISKNSI